VNGSLGRIGEERRSLSDAAQEAPRTMIVIVLVILFLVGVIKL